MPLPVAHSIISASVFVSYKKDFSIASFKKDYRLLALFVFMGLFPDVDFVTVPISGFGAHRGVTHSFFFAALVSSFVFLLLKIWKDWACARLWAFLFAAMALHPVCDYFTYDYLVQRGGVMLFYPFSSRYFESPFPLFAGIELRYLRTIFSLHTLFAIVYETLLSSAIFTITVYVKTRLLKTSRQAEAFASGGGDIDD